MSNIVSNPMSHFLLHKLNMKTYSTLAYSSSEVS